MSSLLDVQAHTDLTSTIKVRDVSPILSVIVSKLPIMQIIPFRGAPAKQNKHEWFDDFIVQKTSTLTANIASHAALAAGLSITVADSTVFLVGDQATIDTIQSVYEVTAIPDGTTLTVKEVRNKALASAAGDEQVIKYNRSALEKSTYADQDAEGARFGDQNINYTQIFRENVEITDSMQEEMRMQHGYGMEPTDAFLNATTQQLRQIGWDLYQAVTLGVGVERTGSTIKGKMNGLREYIDVAGGNVVTASGALTATLLNELSTEIFNDISDLSNIVMVMPTGQNQKMAAFDASRIQYLDPQPTHQVGINVAGFVPNIGGTNGIPVLIDPNMPKTEIWFLDTSRLGIIPLGNRNISFKQQNVEGTTALQGFLTGELTLEVRNGKQAHGIIKNLSI